MGTISKRKGKWYVDFRLPRGLAGKCGVDRFRKGYDKREVAKSVHADLSAAIGKGDAATIMRLLNRADDDYTVATFYERWMSEYCKPRLGKRTVELYAYCFRGILPYCGSVPLKDFRRQRLDGYVKKRIQTVKPTTVNKDIIAIKSMFSFAFDVGVIEADPLMRFPALRVQEKALRIPTPDEYAKLVASMPDASIAAMVQIMGETGLRREEAIRLEWRNVNLQSERLTVENTKSKRVRHVPLSKLALETLRGLKRFVHQPRVFCHQDTGEKWVSPDKAFRAGRKAAGMGWVTMHSLRHMRATRMIGYGVPVPTVKEVLGHADIKTTMRYVHLVDGQLDIEVRNAQEMEENELRVGEKRETGK